MKTCDVLILGAGASGLMCASVAAARGRRVLVLEHQPRPGSKILASGGGRCNFTNRHVQPSRYVGSNPDFIRHVLSRYTPKNFLALLREHSVPFHEKKDGRLFCDKSSRDILRLLLSRAEERGAKILKEQALRELSFADGLFEVSAGRDVFSAPRLVVATGGLSRPQMGASDFGLKVARQFGLKVVEPSPALVGLEFGPRELERFKGLAGIHLKVGLLCGGRESEDDLMITHRGLSGPVILNASLVWRPGGEIVVNWTPGYRVETTFKQLVADKAAGGRGKVRTWFEQAVPRRLADRIAWNAEARGAWSALPEERLKALARDMHATRFVPSGTFGYDHAEVTRGGVDTKELSRETLESRKVPGLFFVGEVVDVTGELGGFNLQWAWSSGWAAGQAV